MTYWGAIAFVSYVNGINYNGYNDWSIPYLPGPCSYCDPSVVTNYPAFGMFELFYNENIRYGQFPNIFENIQAQYWNVNSGSWWFNMNTGNWGNNYDENYYQYLRLVRSGDSIQPINSGSVPEPSVLSLMLLGFIVYIKCNS
jgi:hypothetical protein